MFLRCHVQHKVYTFCNQIDQEQRINIFQTNIICLRYATKITLHCSEESIANDKQLLLFVINFSFVAEFLITMKTIYKSFSNFFFLL